MPNWCMNTLAVHGKPADVDAFIEGVKNNPITQTDAFSEPQKPYFSILETYDPLPGGKWQYDLAIQHWGTKWSDCHLQIPESTGSDIGTFMFDTAWAPPMDGIRNLSERFENLVFGISYYEPGMDFAGISVFYKGDCEYESEEDIPDFWSQGDDDRAMEAEATYYDSLDAKMAVLARNVSDANGVLV